MTIKIYRTGIYLVWPSSWDLPHWAYRLCGPGFLRPRLCCHGEYENAIGWEFR